MFLFMEGENMKIYKRAAALLALGMITCSAVPMSAKTTTQQMKDLTDIGLRKPYRASTGTSVSKNQIKVYLDVEKRDGKTYLMIDPDNYTSSIKDIKVEGSSISLSDKYNGKYYYQVKESATYDVDVYDWDGNYGYASKKVSFTDEDPTLSLSKTKKNGTTYLVIKAYDDVKIKKVTVNGESISFSSSGETKEYKVTESGKYEVVVTDSDNNKTTETYTITLDDSDLPTLKLSQTTSGNKTYLVINAKPSVGKISKVTVDGKKIDFPAKGGEVQYEVTANGSYRVVVKNSNELEKSDTYSVTINQKKGIAPVLTGASSGNILIISVSDDVEVSKLTVNGTPVTIAKSGGTIQYPVAGAGVYTVVATDNEGNQTSKLITVASATSSVTTATNTSTSQKSVFKLNSKTWSLGGVTQPAMQAATTSKGGRIYLPLRYVSYAIGVQPGNIAWDNKTKTVTIQDGGHTIKVKLNSKTMYLDGEAIEMDAAAIQKGTNVMVPISQVAKAFKHRNVNCVWQDTQKQVVITHN